MSDKVHCSHILVKTELEAKAILDQLNKGESFAKIAIGKSLCPKGTFGRGQMVREFERTAFALQKGQISQPVKTEFGWHIIKRLD